MQDYMTAAVAARHAELRKIAGRRWVRRSGRVIDLDARTTTVTAVPAAPVAQPAAETAEELTFACTR
jgi:hypothetical protein